LVVDRAIGFQEKHNMWTTKNADVYIFERRAKTPRKSRQIAPFAAHFSGNF